MIRLVFLCYDPVSREFVRSNGYGCEVYEWCILTQEYETPFDKYAMCRVRHDSYTLFLARLAELSPSFSGLVVEFGNMLRDFCGE